MSWCPKCGYEYQQGIWVCPDCNIALKAQPPKENLLSTDINLVSVIGLDNEVQGTVFQSVLQEQGIESVIRDYTVQPYPGAIYSKGRWGSLLVLEPDFDNAKFIITEYLNSLDQGLINENESGFDETDEEGDNDQEPGDEDDRYKY